MLITITFFFQGFNFLILGFCPASKELAKTRVKQLADSLKVLDENGRTKDKETSTNLLCWEHRKLSFFGITGLGPFHFST
ncbi:MAG: hypothetical protein NWF00_10925 [Candidatus Bathyarchaeota archaeon]|nr:hypothetical protein [Candidatus Bathyarchaeota archaeon]